MADGENKDGGAAAGAAGAAGAAAGGAAAGGDNGAAAAAKTGGGDPAAGGAKPGDAGAAAGGDPAAGGAAKPGTLVAEGGTNREAAPAADWPADWRAKLAGDDKKVLAQLERFASPADMAKKLREQDALISSGKLKAGLPADATAEQVAAWRKDNNIPEAPDKYDLTLPDGLVIGEADKPIINNMLTSMHGANLNQDQVKAVLASYYKQEQAFLVERTQQIAADKIKQDDTLHSEWGNEYRQNLNIVSDLIKTWSEDTRNALSDALDSNGMPLLNNAAFLRDMAVQARTINPISTVVSGGGASQMSSVEDEIKAIETRMATDRDAYFKDTKAQARYLQLIEWKENQKKRA
jgi:hypothetical protein